MSEYNSRQEFRKKDKMPLLLVGAGLLALIIFFSVIFTKDPRPDENLGSAPPGQSLNPQADSEAILGKLRDMEAQLASFGKGRDDAAQVIQRLDGLEASLMSRMDRIESRLGALGRKLAKAGHAKQTRPPIPPAKTSGKASDARHYEVQAGDTLYKISRDHGLTVEMLRRLNHLGSDAAIRPGDKLIVSPVKDGEIR